MSKGVGSRLADVGGRHLFVNCSGIGSPTVVLEAGAGEGLTTWAQIQPFIETFTHVCSYDRAGLGQSERGPQPCTTQEMVDDLHALLVAAQIPGPYVLVGHSLGGMIVRLYTHRFPEEVVGIVLIDAPHPEQGARFTTAVSPETARTNSLVRNLLQMSKGGDPNEHPEGLDFAASLVQVGASDGFGDLPLVVLTHRDPSDGSVLLAEQPELPIDVALTLERVWQDLQADLARLSTKSMHIIANKSGHYIHLDEPQLVIEAIRQVVETVRHST
jgi:pimeloyl-ACP methyl ester carboxylesterase